MSYTHRENNLLIDHSNKIQTHKTHTLLQICCCLSCILKYKKSSNRLAEVTRANKLALHPEQSGENSGWCHMHSTLVNDRTWEGGMCILCRHGNEITSPDYCTHLHTHTHSKIHSCIFSCQGHSLSNIVRWEQWLLVRYYYKNKPFL